MKWRTRGHKERELQNEICAVTPDHTKKLAIFLTLAPILRKEDRILNQRTR